MDKHKAQEIVRRLPTGEVGDEVFAAISSLAQAGFPQILEEIVYRRSKYRPPQKNFQYQVLLQISREHALSENLRINAGVAAGHKAIEMGSESLVNDSILRLKGYVSDAGRLHTADKIRSDRVHVKFSSLTLLLNLYLWKEDWAGFCEVTPLVSAHYPSLEDIGGGFYQTCMNVARSSAIAALPGLAAGGESATQAVADAIKNVELALFRGILHSTDDRNVFGEYIDCAIVLRSVRDLEAELSRKAPAGDRVSLLARKLAMEASRHRRTQTGLTVGAFVQHYIGPKSDYAPH